MHSAIVTGGAQGIGKAITLKLLEKGVFVFILDMDQEALDEFLGDKHPNRFFQALRCDVSDDKQLTKTLESIIQQQPHLKYLINNAATSASTPMQQLSVESWLKVINTNLTSYFVTVKVLSEDLARNKGAVVNLCSTRAFMSEPHTEAYSASKGGVFALTHSQAMSLNPHVRVNSISPGWIDVNPWQKSGNRKSIDWAAKHHTQHPAGRIGKPEDIAEMTWFLLSDASGFITGQNFFVDGGMTRKMIYESE